MKNILKDMFDAIKKDALLGIPLLVIAGSIMIGGSMARRLIDFAESLVVFLPCSFAIFPIFACMVFAAICKSSL